MEHRMSTASIKPVDDLLALVSNLREGSDLLTDEQEQQFKELDESVWRLACRLNLQAELPKKPLGSASANLRHHGSTNLPVIVRLGGFVPYVLTDWKKDMAAFRDIAAAELAESHAEDVKAALETSGPEPVPVPIRAPSADRTERPPAYVTLRQMAALVSRGKRTLERRKKGKNPLPDPDSPGGGGKPDEWLWERIRPWLEDEFGKRLPEEFNPQWFKLREANH
jgi:hypothetical protein